MKLIDSHYEILEQSPGFVGGLRFIEKVARTCYMSEDRITDESYKRMVQSLVDREHTAMLEFCTLYLTIRTEDVGARDAIDFYTKNPYSRVRLKMSDTGRLHAYITTNYRVIVQSGRFQDLQAAQSHPTLEHYKRTTVRLFCNRSVSHEVVRHRLASFAQQSQRYVCYSMDRFGGEITFIIPDKIYRIRDERAKCIDPLTGESMSYLSELSGEKLVNALICIDRGVSCWYDSMVRDEKDYIYLTKEEGWAPQDARDVLPNACSTILNVCMYDEDWIHFFNLRSVGVTGKPDPNMKRLVDPILEDFIKLGKVKYDNEKNLVLC